MSKLEAAEELHGAAEDLANLDNVASPHHAIRNVFDLMPTASTQDWGTVVARLGAVPLALRGYAGSLRAAARQGHVVPRRQVAAAIAQCADYGRPDGFFGMLAAQRRQHGARTESGPLPDALTADLAANAARLRPPMPTRNLPARRAHGAGAGPRCRRPGLYTLHSRAFLGTRVDLDETYDWGQRELASIVERHGRHRTGDPARRIGRLGNRLSGRGAGVHLHGTDALRDWMQATSDAAIDALADRHFDIPAPIRRLECLIAPTEEGGIYYTQPLRTDHPSRSHVVVGAAQPDQVLDVEGTLDRVPRRRAGSSSADRTDSVPQRQLNRWRRIGSLVSGHAEGWALYAERLMVELGYLDRPADRLGALDQQSLRAARVVLDIGVHCDLAAPASVGGGRWDYGKAWQFLSAHSRMAEPVLRYELDRYLGWPGQAPSYKIGERHWLQLRDQARAAQGAAFDLKSFRRRVLDIGSVGLDVLQAAVLGSGQRNNSCPLTRGQRLSSWSGPPEVVGGCGRAGADVVAEA